MQLTASLKPMLRCKRSITTLKFEISESVGEVAVLKERKLRTTGDRGTAHGVGAGHITETGLLQCGVDRFERDGLPSFHSCQLDRMGKSSQVKKPCDEFIYIDDIERR